jgi:hypothetical protein
MVRVQGNLFEIRLLKSIGKIEKGERENGES